MADDKRVQFYLPCIIELRQALREMVANSIVRYDPVEVIPVLMQELKIDAVFTNRDYAEPQSQVAMLRSKQHRQALTPDFLRYKDQVIFEEDEVLSLANKPFRFSRPKNARLKRQKLASEVESGPDFISRPIPSNAMPPFAKLS